jgi:phage-related protein
MMRVVRLGLSYDLFSKAIFHRTLSRCLSWGKGVEEIRIRTDDAYRIFYVARFEEAVYVLHAFQKKSQKTSRSDIELGQQRYNQMIQQRQDYLE